MDGRLACPLRVFEDNGGAFLMGFVGSVVINAAQLFKAPKGQRLKYTYFRVASKAPALGVAFGVWGGLFATFDCILSQLRGKDDTWNVVLSGATVSALLSSRNGLPAMGKHFMIGGVIMLMIEGLVHTMSSLMSQTSPIRLDLPSSSQRSSFVSSVFYKDHLEKVQETDEMKQAYKDYIKENTSLFSVQYWKNLFASPQTPSKAEDPSQSADREHEILVNLMRTSDALKTIANPPGVKPM